MVKLNFDIAMLKGLSIQQCLRHFHGYDLSHIPDEFRDQEADGNIYLTFSNDITIELSADTERFSIGVEKRDELKLSNFTNVSENIFWKAKIGQTIKSAEFLYCESEYPYGLKFELESQINIIVEYVSESVYEFDAIVVRSL